MRVFLATAATALAALVAVSPALSWAWVLDGSIVRPFVVDDSPYSAGQRRGVDIEAPVRATVRAPSAGTVTFAGTVPRGGRTVTILTDDGYKATLQQLTGLLVHRDDAVNEGDPIGQVAESRDPAATYSHVHLGVRQASVEHGYVDPLSLRPAARSDSSGSGGSHVPVVTYVPDPAPLSSPAAEPNGAGDSAEAVAAESEPDTTPAEEAVTETGEAEAEEAVAEATSEPSWDFVAADEFTADISIDSSLPSSSERERTSESTSTAQQATGREVSDGRAERSAVSGTLDPVETATEQAWAAAARALIDAAAGQRAGSDPADPSNPRGQPAPARPADARPILGAATARQGTAARWSGSLACARRGPLNRQPLSCQSRLPWRSSVGSWRGVGRQPPSGKPRSSAARPRPLRSHLLTLPSPQRNTRARKAFPQRISLRWPSSALRSVG
ncbi:MAG: peptidoglycan DD-metalloendopeptidase family protein [Actinomycetia bacterium]|nr:peptidoglycan DD-metalloendopeptidase family protein [Actinomycetes bacterium]